MNALAQPNKKIDGRQTHCNLASERQNNNTNTNNGMISNVFVNNSQPMMNRMIPNISVSGMGLNMIGMNNYNHNNMITDPFMFNQNAHTFASFHPNIISNHPSSSSYPPPMNSNPPLLMNQLLTNANSMSATVMNMPTMPMPLSSMPNYNPLMQWTPSRTLSNEQLLIENDTSAMLGLPMMPGMPGMPAIPAMPSFLNTSKSFQSIGLPSPFLNSGVLSPPMPTMNGHFDDMVNKKIVSAGITSDKHPMFLNRRHTQPLTAANLNMFDNMNSNGMFDDRFHVQMLPTLTINANASAIVSALHTNGNAQTPKTQHSDEDRK